MCFVVIFKEIAKLHTLKVIKRKDLLYRVIGTLQLEFILTEP